jgi:dienelactone hydrolase
MPEYLGNIQDDRGRFREIFCTVLDEHGQDLPDYMPCEEALTEVGTEPPGTGRPVDLGQNRGGYLVGIVPGFGWDCIQGWLNHQESGPKHVAQWGYESAFIGVEGLSGTSTNAAMINEFLSNLPPEDDGRPIIMMGYSKGAPDLLDFLASYPDTAKRVVAVVALAGAVSGSPLALDATQDQANLLTKVPKSDCAEGDGGAVNALKPAVRKQWLADNPLPTHIKYYSVVTFPDPDSRMSSGLKSSYKNLSELADARNDSQVVFYDQVIPGSTLIAFANADHWALAVPVDRQHTFVGSTFVNHNDYPRESMFEAIIRYVEEDLE